MSDQDCILIIDDSEDVTLPLEHHFKTQGTRVIVNANPASALAAVSAERPDLILLAASLGETDGLALFRRLRDAPRTAHIPIMFIVGFRDLRRQNDLLAAGADDVIARPFDVEILALRIRNAIQRSRREGVTDSVTGLPTGTLLTDRAAVLAARPEWCTLNVQLAHFDAFRARYDFITGNEVLRYAGNSLLELVEGTGVEDAYAGFRGEASFVLIVPCDRVAALTGALTGALQDGLHQFYTFMERDQGYVESEDGRQQPLIQVRVTPAA